MFLQSIWIDSKSQSDNFFFNFNRIIVNTKHIHSGFTITYLSMFFSILNIMLGINIDLICTE